MAVCPKCREGERAKGQAWCRPCLTQAQRDRRAALKAARTFPGGEPTTLTAGGLNAEAAKVMACPRCAATAATIRAGLEAFRRAADVGVVSRLGRDWRTLRETILAALDAP